MEKSKHLALYCCGHYQPQSTKCAWCGKGEGDTPSRSPEIVEHDYKDREPDCPICLDTGTVQPETHRSDPCACAYDRPLPDGYVDPPRPQTPSERIREAKAALLKAQESIALALELLR